MLALPHGGRLIARVLSGERREEALRGLPGLPQLALSEDKACQVDNIATGTYSPLEGFMTRDDLASVLDRKRLASDVPWTIPIVLDADPRVAETYREGQDIALTCNGRSVGILHLEEKYAYDKEEFGRQVYGTVDPSHPGIRRLSAMGDVLLAGEVDLLESPDTPFARHHLTPRETRVLFAARGWRTVAGFQTRNVPHLGHEHLQKTALALVDGIFINPVVGQKRKGDFKDEVILSSYDALLRNYFPKDRAVLAILRTGMHYAGPREAVFHAIVRKNYGCTHFVVGRDHAGFGSFYPPHAAQEIFDEFPDLGIVPLCFPASFYCFRCQAAASEKTCPHDESNHLAYSGTRLREAILEESGESTLLVRPEVAEAIRRYASPFVEEE